MRALVLAAGWATRLGALAAERPKALLPVGDRTPLDFVVGAARRVPGLWAVDILAHERARPAFAAWAAGVRGDPPVTVLGNGVARPEDRRGAVADLAWFLTRHRIDDDLLVLGADLVFDFALDGLAAAAAQEPSVVVFDVGRPSRVSSYASVELGEDGRVRRLVEKDPAPRTSLAATALYGLPCAALGDPARYLAEGGAPDNLGHLAAWWVAQARLRAVPATGTWIDVGTPEEYARACRACGASGASASGDGAR